MSIDATYNVVAIDLCKDYTQVAYCREKMSEPESVSTIPGEQRFLIPTVVGRTKDEEVSKWLVGDEAERLAKEGTAKTTGDILGAILSEDGIYIGDEKYTAHEIMTVFFNGLFRLLKRNLNITNPDKIVVTVEFPDRILVNLLRSVLTDMGYEKNKIKIIGHSESLIYYTIFQKKELWVNDVLVFDFTENQFLARRLTTIRARMPQPVIVEEKDLSSTFDIQELQSEHQRVDMDRKFLEVLKKMCGEHIVSTVYLTGKGFYENWMEESLSFLCTKRRVFQGYNLFVKGAAYAGLCSIGVGSEDTYQFICSGRTVINIELDVEKGDDMVPIVLSKAGTNWYEAGAKAEGILDNTDQIRLRFVSSLTKRERILNIDLRGFPQRPNKTTRIEVMLAYRNDSQCVIAVKDLGFGDFFKSEGNVVKTTINIEDYL